MKNKIFTIACLLIATVFSGQASAISSGDWNSILNNSIYYNGNSSTQSVNSGFCVSMSCININDKGALISSIAKFINGLSSTSPFNGTEMATAIVDGSIAENVNPFLVVSIGWHESQLGAEYPPGSFNAFGRKAGPGQPSVSIPANGSSQPSSWYAWPSWLASVSDSNTDEQNLIKVVYVDLGINSIPAFVNKYAPSGDGNNTQGYISYLNTEIGAMVVAAGNSVTVNYGGGGVTTTAIGCSSSITSTDTRQRIVDIAEQQLSCWQKGTIQPPGGPIYDYSGINEEWCADFASWVYKQAGHPFTGGNGGWDLPGVSEIYALGLSGNGFVFHPSGSYTPQPGDLAIHSDSGAYYGYMGHVNIVVSVNSGGNVSLIGGDQTNPSVGQWTLNTSIVSEVGSEPSTSDSIIGYVSPN